MNLLKEKTGFVGPTFSLSNRIKRALWMLVWLLAARWTPPQLHRWRIFLIRLFGGNVSWHAYIYPSTEIWAPWNLTVEDFGTLARNVVCYNIAPVSIGNRAVISQGANLCTGSHEYQHPDFPLTAKPIHIGRRAWVCAGAFIGPGVTVGDGVVLAANAVAFRNLDAWSVYLGNPAVFKHPRQVIND